jgi:hypothetical protein
MGIFLMFSPNTYPLGFDRTWLQELTGLGGITEMKFVSQELVRLKLVDGKGWSLWLVNLPKQESHEETSRTKTLIAGFDVLAS